MIKGRITISLRLRTELEISNPMISDHSGQDLAIVLTCAEGRGSSGLIVVDF